ncbi:50S ribosomal protein L33 [Myxococcus virescens]|uniref:Large ribosomal subunit protein bL33 n=2 Tax=Myxococcus virescens TaxID=83456 RepID=A0A511HD35_9BACT|nr:50S ribosomal protein L33 [Myxococcus virescens]
MSARLEPTMPKGNRTIIHLVSSAGTGYVYTTTKNKRKSQEKLQLRKYDPRVRKHVMFVEGKP